MRNLIKAATGQSLACQHQNQSHRLNLFVEFMLQSKNAALQLQFYTRRIYSSFICGQNILTPFCFGCLQDRAYGGSNLSSGNLVEEA